MTHLFDLPTLLAYFAAAVLLAVSPGPGQALVVARTISGGPRDGFLTSIGLGIGTLIHTVAAAFGLSALLATSATAYAAVKYAGAAYLTVLGVLAILRSRQKHSGKAGSPIESERVSGTRLVIHGAVTGTLNPKVALFFIAFLPQFVRPERGMVIVQFLVLGVLSAILGTISDVTVSQLVYRAGGHLTSSARFARWRERITGSIFIALGLRLALGDRR